MNYYKTRYSTPFQDEYSIYREGDDERMATAVPESHADLYIAAPNLLKTLEHAEQTMRNLGNGELAGDAKTIALNASRYMQDAIKLAKGEV